MLHQVTGFWPGKNSGYCGPSAACLITGIRYTEATAVIREISGKRSVKGMTTGLMARTMAALGWPMRCVEHDPDGRRTFARWLRERKPEQLQATYILVVGRTSGHFVVVQGRKGGDSFSRGPVWLSDMKWRRRPVTQVFEVRETDAAAKGRVVARLADETARKRRVQGNAARTRRKWRKEAEGHAGRLGLRLAVWMGWEDDDDITYDLPEDKRYRCEQSLWFVDWREAARVLADIVPSDFEYHDDMVEVD